MLFVRVQGLFSGGFELTGIEVVGVFVAVPMCWFAKRRKEKK